MKSRDYSKEDIIKILAETCGIHTLSVQLFWDISITEGNVSLKENAIEAMKEQRRAAQEKLDIALKFTAGIEFEGSISTSQLEALEKNYAEYQARLSSIKNILTDKTKNEQKEISDLKEMLSFCEMWNFRIKNDTETWKLLRERIMGCIGSFDRLHLEKYRQYESATSQFLNKDLLFSILARSTPDDELPGLYEQRKQIEKAADEKVEPTLKESKTQPSTAASISQTTNRVTEENKKDALEKLKAKPTQEAKVELKTKDSSTSPPPVSVNVQSSTKEKHPEQPTATVLSSLPETMTAQDKEILVILNGLLDEDELKSIEGWADDDLYFERVIDIYKFCLRHDAFLKTHSEEWDHVAGRITHFLNRYIASPDFNDIQSFESVADINNRLRELENKMPDNKKPLLKKGLTEEAEKYFGVSPEMKSPEPSMVSIHVPSTPQTPPSKDALDKIANTTRAYHSKDVVGISPNDNATYTVTLKDGTGTDTITVDDRYIHQMDEQIKKTCDSLIQKLSACKSMPEKPRGYFSRAIFSPPVDPAAGQVDKFLKILNDEKMSPAEKIIQFRYAFDQNAQKILAASKNKNLLPLLGSLQELRDRGVVHFLASTEATPTQQVRPSR